jgi:hypothetical protein
MIRSRPKNGLMDWPAVDPSHDDRLLGDPSGAGTPKARRCLKCRSPFQSEWAGERVCVKCKKKTQWRSGSLPSSF